jgi:phosphate transport system protein
MSQHFFREVEALKQQLLTLGTLVEDRIAKAIDSVMKHDAELALQVVRGDNEIDEMEVEVEEECLKILALYQPVAVDLRFVVAVLKINNDLERMADKAVNIARRAEYLAQFSKTSLPPSLAAMAKESEAMVRHCLDAFVQEDTALARQVCADDRAVDRYNRDMHKYIQEQIRLHPEDVERLIHTLSVARHLERIGDLATNVAEDVIYTVEGAIVRHRTSAYG